MARRSTTTKTKLAARSAGLVLLSILGACGNDPHDVLGPPTTVPAPVFEFVRQMISDPWFAESLPGQLRNRVGAASIQTTIGVNLRMAVEPPEQTRLGAALGSLEAAVHAYRSQPEFDPTEGAVLAVFELFVEQARAIRDGAISWSPMARLREDQG